MFDPKYLESSEFYQRRYHNFSTLIIVPIFILVIFLFLFSLFAKRELTVKSIGQLIPEKGLSTVQSTSNNTINKNYLAENKFVNAGDTLVTFKNKQEKISSQLLNQQINTVNERLISLEKYKDSINEGSSQFEGTDKFGYDSLFSSYIAQVNYLIHDFNQKSSDKVTADQQAKSQTNLLKRAQTKSQKQINYYQQILNSISANIRPTNNPYQYIYDNYNSKLQTARTTEEKLQIKQTTTSNLKQQIERLNSTTTDVDIQIASITKSGPLSKDSTLDKISDLKQQQLASIQKEITSQQQDLNELKYKKRINKKDYQDTIIKAPETGLLHLEMDTSKTKYLPKGKTIAQIYPKLSSSTKLHVNYYIPAENITGIKKGQAVRFIIHQNVIKPLILNGQIIKIATAPINNKNGSFYICEAKLTIPKKDYKHIKYGITGHVTTIKGSKTWFNYYKDIILGDNY